MRLKVVLSPSCTLFFTFKVILPKYSTKNGDIYAYKSNRRYSIFSVSFENKVCLYLGCYNKHFKIYC